MTHVDMTARPGMARARLLTILEETKHVLNFVANPLQHSANANALCKSTKKHEILVVRKTRNYHRSGSIIYESMKVS